MEALSGHRLGTVLEEEEVGKERIVFHKAARKKRPTNVRQGRGGLVHWFGVKGLAVSTRRDRARGLRYLVRGLYEWDQMLRDETCDGLDLYADRRWLWSGEWKKGGKIETKALKRVTLPPTEEDFEGALMVVAARQSRRARALAAMALDEVARMMVWHNDWNSEQKREAERRVTARLNRRILKASVRPLDMAALDEALRKSWMDVGEVVTRAKEGQWTGLDLRPARVHAAVVVCLSGLMRAADCASVHLEAGRMRSLVTVEEEPISALAVFLMETKTGAAVSRLVEAGAEHWDPIRALRCWLRMFDVKWRREGKEGGDWLQGKRKANVRVDVVGVWRTLGSRKEGCVGKATMWADLKRWLEQYYVRPAGQAALDDRRQESPHSFRATAAVGVLPVVGGDRTRTLGRWRGTGAYDVYAGTSMVPVGDILSGAATLEESWWGEVAGVGMEEDDESELDEMELSPELG